MLWWFAETTLIAGLLAGVAAALGRVWSIGPTARHLLWLVVLVKLMVPPVIPSPWPLSVPNDWPFATWLPTDESPPVVLPGRPEIIAQDSASGALCTSPDAEPEAAASGPVVILASTAGHAAEARPAIARLEEGLEPAEHRSWAWKSPDASTLRRWALWCWILGAVGLGLVQASRIVKFRNRLRDAVPAPAWLVEEAEAIGTRLGVRTPEVLAVPNLGTPMLWCLGRPKLLLPCHLIKSLEASRWRGILAHELAHLCRGDHWVGRLELAAGLVWWWNPLYWLARRRLDAEAELACDAWVIWALPDDRLSYAEVLFQICSEFSLAGSPAPALGVAGSGRFFERRLTMILSDRVPCRISPLLLMAACLLALLALPSWTLATPSALAATAVAPSVGTPAPPSAPSASQPGDDDDDADEADDDDSDDDADDDDADDDDADDDDDHKESGKSDKKSADKHEKESRKSKSGKGDVDVDVDVAGIEKLVKSALGPDFEKKMEDWGEKFGKEMEEKFGENSEFAKKMEALGKEMEKKFGEDSEFAKEMEKKFGDGSEFAKKMESFGKEMEKKFGPGSDFEKKMKGVGEKMEKQFGPGSDFEKKMKAKADAAVAKARAKEDKAKAKAKAKPSADMAPPERDKSRADRVKALEAKIRELAAELKALKSAERDDDDDEK